MATVAPATRTKEIWALALPIIGGMTSQNILNLVDTAMVGALGAAALAGVGLASFINFLAMAAVTGLSVAVQAIAARRVGEGRAAEAALPLNGGLLLSVLIGAPIAIIMMIAAPAIFAALNPDPAVAAAGVPYLQMRLLSVPALGMNFSFRGYWSATRRTHLYFITLVSMHSINMLLNYGLIFGHFGLPKLGTLGAGLGTTLSLCGGAIAYFVIAKRVAAHEGFLRQAPTRNELMSQLRVGVPAMAQQLLFAAGFVVLFGIIGRIGTGELAVANVLVNITLVTVLPGMGFGLAAGTLAGQALGRGDADAAYQSLWAVYKECCKMLAPFALIMLCFPQWTLGWFFDDPALIALAHLPLQLIGATVLADALGMVLMNTLLGVGATRAVLVVAVGLQWLLFLPLALLLGPILGWGLNAVWIAMVGYRGLQVVLLTRIWQRRAWVQIKL